jgi:hypothetical protein
VVKRVTVMFAMILIGLGVGIGAGLLPANPRAQVAVAAIGGLVMWGLVKVLSRDGDIWKFGAPYP